MEYNIVELSSESPIWQQAVELAPRINDEIPQQLVLELEWIHDNHVLVAFVEDNPVGLLRFVEQRIGEDEGRPPLVFKGKTLVEGKVIAFGVLPEFRNHGIGRALQERAIEIAREKGCYQLRSRSKYEKQANFHLKMSLGSGIQPSLTDDSVYFVIVL